MGTRDPPSISTSLGYAVSIIQDKNLLATIFVTLYSSQSQLPTLMSDYTQKHFIWLGLDLQLDSSCHSGTLENKDEEILGCSDSVEKDLAMALSVHRLW